LSCHCFSPYLINPANFLNLFAKSAPSLITVLEGLVDATLLDAYPSRTVFLAFLAFLGVIVDSAKVV